MEQIQAAATSKLGGKDIAAGELAFLNSLHIQQLRLTFLIIIFMN